MENKTEGKAISKINVEMIANDIDTRIGGRLSVLRCCIVTALNSINRAEADGDDESAGITAIAFLKLFCDAVENVDDEARSMANMIRQLAATAK